MSDQVLAQGERKPLPARLYALSRQVVGHGMSVRYLPRRGQALALDGLRDPSILEVGCGTGEIPSRGFAIDLDAHRVKVVAAEGRTAAVTNGCALPFVDRAFAVVYCEGVLHHLPDESAERLVLGDAPRLPARRSGRRHGLGLAALALSADGPSGGPTSAGTSAARTSCWGAAARRGHEERFTDATIGLECLLAVLVR